MLARVLEPETLDHLAADDPIAQRSRRDLRRVNRVMGARGILVRALQRVVRADASSAPLRVVELGCGDGSLMLDVARSGALGSAAVELTLLDQLPIVSAATIADYAQLGWCARPATTDVLTWAADTASAERWDVVVANLFLHHFDGDALRTLLAGCARRADAVARLRAAAQPFRARRQPPRGLRRRQRGDAARCRA